MYHFLLLALYTLIIGWLGFKIYRKTRSGLFILGILALYYWSLLGAWFIVFDSLTNNAGQEWGLHYYTYFQKMFPVNADGTYALCNFLYFIFIVACELAVLYFVKTPGPQRERRIFRLNHFTLLLACFVLFLISISIVFKQMIYAAYVDQSIYTITRGTENKFFALHQICNNLLIAGLFFGLVIHMSGNNQPADRKKNRTINILYLVALILFESYMLMLGNKKEIFTCGLAAALFFAYNNDIKKMYKKMVLVGMMILVPMYFNDSLRAVSPGFLTWFFNKSTVTFIPPPKVSYTEFNAKNTLFAFVFNNEMFAGHFSMYGCIKYHVPLTYGKSLVFLASSFVPKFINPNRPDDAYVHYANALGIDKDQGFTLHHATGWYINFWYFGVVAGGILLGYLWALSFNILLRPGNTKKRFVVILYAISAFAFTASFPVLVRSGIEAYKIVLVESILLPVTFLFLSGYSVRDLLRLRFNQPQSE